MWLYAELEDRRWEICTIWGIEMTDMRATRPARYACGLGECLAVLILRPTSSWGVISNLHRGVEQPD